MSAEAEAFFRDSTLGVAVFRKVLRILEAFGAVEVRTTRTQVAFRRKRGFAYLWRPGQHLRNPDAEVVLSIALGRHDTSPRFKEVAHPSRLHWMHHLEVPSIDQIDAEVEEWLREAADRST